MLKYTGKLSVAGFLHQSGGKIMEISKFPFSQTLSSTTTGQETKAAACTSKSQPFSRVLDEKKQKVKKNLKKDLLLENLLLNH